MSGPIPEKTRSQVITEAARAALACIDHYVDGLDADTKLRICEHVRCALRHTLPQHISTTTWRRAAEEYQSRVDSEQ